MTRLASLILLLSGLCMAQTNYKLQGCVATVGGQVLCADAPEVNFPMLGDFPAQPKPIDWDSAKCTALLSGEVHCPEAAFKKLVDSVIDARAEAEKAALRLAAANSRVEALEAALVATNAPTPLTMAKAKPAIAVATAIIGTVAVTTAMSMDSLSTGARIGLGVAGAAAVAGSLAIVF